MITCTYAIYSALNPPKTCANEAAFIFVLDTPFGIVSSPYCVEHEALSRGRDHDYCTWLRSTPITPAYHDGWVAGQDQATPIRLSEVACITIFSDPTAALDVPRVVDPNRVALPTDEADLERWHDGFDDGWVAMLRSKALAAVYKSNSEAAADLHGVPETGL